MRRSLAIKTTNNRCPFLPHLLKLPISKQTALDVLLDKGYVKLEFDILSIARKCIGKSVYQHNHHPDNAPNFVDCASFVRWLYGHYGIWLPRYSIQQHNCLSRVSWEKRKPGDLIFCGRSNGKFWTNPKEQVGHVGMLTGHATVIHAAGSNLGVIETNVTAFTKPQAGFRGAGRICDLFATTTLQIRPGRLIETLDDLRWDILNTLGR